MTPHCLRLLKLHLHRYVRWYQAFGLREGARLFWHTRDRSRGNGGTVLQLVSPHLVAPVYLRSGSSDIAAFEKIFVWKQYQVPTRGLPGIKTVLDCGGNCGLSAAWFATQYREAKIIVLEPEPKNFELLLKNTRAFKNVIPIQAAIFNRECVVKIQNPDAAPDAYRFQPCDDVVTDSVSAYDPESIRERFAVDSFDLVKIDIEGGEVDLFSQGSSTWLNRTRILLIEIHGAEARRNVEKAMPRSHWRQHMIGENDCFINLAVEQA